MGFKMFGKRLLSAALTLSMVAGMMVTGVGAASRDWVQVSQKNENYVYKLDTDGSIDPQKGYLIVAPTTGNILTVAKGSISTQEETVERNTIELSTDAHEWTITSDGKITNGNYWLCVGLNGLSVVLSLQASESRATNWTVNSTGDGNYRVFYDGIFSKYYLKCGSGFSLANSQNSVRLFEWVSDPSEDLFVKLYGTFSYHVPQGTSEEEVLNTVKAGISAQTGTTDQGANPADLADDQLTWEISGYNANQLGDYTVTIKHTASGNTLGTATVSVKEVEKAELIDDKGTVSYGADSSAETSAKIKLIYKDGTSSETPVTLDMLSGADIDTSKVVMDSQGVYANNVYENLTVIYHGAVLSKSFTLSVLPTMGYPEFPNEGSVRFDKTATAIGDFDSTGIVQMELSMTGVPYTTNNELDVVLVLDRSPSMEDYNRLELAKEAAKTFVKTVVVNEDGTYNNNRVSIVTFCRTSRTERILDTVDDLDAVNTVIDNISTSSATNYSVGLSEAQRILNAAKTDGIGNDRQQFCVFLSDGEPNTYYTVGEKTVDAENANWVTNGTRNNNYQYEYYSTQMKKDGITIYSVALGITKDTPLFLLHDISGPANEEEHDTGSERTKDEKYFFSVSDADAAANLSTVFKNIASKILEAAKNIVVRDKIAEEYSMIFDIPKGDQEISDLENQEFYIEVKEHTLDENHERTGDYTSLSKVYLGTNSNNTYYAATAAGSANGTNKCEDPEFAEVTADAEGVKPKAYYSIIKDDTQVGKDDIVIEVNGEKYLFMPAGNGTHNITSGAYAYGTINSTTNTSDDLVIITPYFAYSAATRMLAWTIEKLTTTELALSYFLYLENSATQIGTDQMISAGSYPTNEWADVNYTNYTGNTASREFPVPQQTWNGAQVSYVFYLVNKKGEPINKSGQVVDFANASFVTDVFTESVVWKDSGGTGELNIEYLAQKLLPQDYTVYDKEANYTIHVYQKAVDSTVLDYFIIGGSEEGLTSKTTTKVYNTRAGARYDKYGVYSAAEAGKKFSTTNADGETVEIKTTQKADNLDYSDTTVAFAVVWEPKLVEDIVVVDYGLDVVVDVVSNDLMQNTVSGIGLGKEAYGRTEMNTGVSEISMLGTTSQTQKGLTISLENANSVRIHQNDMKFDEPVTFYYESPVEFYEGSSKKSGYMYSSITVVPATSIYYEENFVDFDAGWQNAGAASTATQAQDRPGDLQLSASLDANNLYGYDSAYANMTEYSMGSAKKATVSGTKEATASFTFTGTGFDVISLTSSNSGTITVEVEDEAGTKLVAGPYLVDTYYGYSYGELKNEKNEPVLDENGKQAMGWYVDPHTPNTLYQVPVMKVTGLDYGTYTATITAAYGEVFDHVGDSSYDFYLDAVRIYDPAGNRDAVKGYHTADKEYSPKYKELRDILIKANGFGTNGSVFIDGYSNLAEIAMYKNFGPNNEVYLASDQSVSFELNAASISGGTVESVQIGLSSTGGTAVAEIQGGGVSKTVSVGATDMYYDITEMDNSSVKITNMGSDILSVTNIKVTLKAPN